MYWLIMYQRGAASCNFSILFESDRNKLAQVRALLEQEFMSEGITWYDMASTYRSGSLAETERNADNHTGS